MIQWRWFFEKGVGRKAANGRPVALYLKRRWQGALHSLAPARLALMGRLQRCVAPLPAAWLYIEECFCQTNPTEKSATIRT